MNDFKGRHFGGEIVLWAVRWYCRYAVSYRDLEAMMPERGIAVDSTRRFTSMDGFPDASDVEMSAWVSCRHLSGITRVRVPKWGIRAHPPLQLVGLGGLDRSQARGAPVRPVQLISSSSRNLVVGLQLAAW